MEKMHRSSNVAKIAEKVNAKPTLGLPLGNCKLTFRYADQSAIEFEGFISDVTGLFVNPDIQADFKRVILEEVSFLKANSFKPIEPEPEEKAEDETLTDNNGSEPFVEQETSLAVSTADSSNNDFDKSALKKAIMAFKTFDFSEACRVLLLEEGIAKHLILQVGRIDLLTSYANNIDHSQWSLIRGLKYDFLADGAAATLPHQQRLRELGEVFLHVFIPEDHKANSKINFKALNSAKVLLAITPFIPQTVDIDQTLKAKDDEIESKESALKMARASLAEKSIRNDSGAIAVASYEEFNPEATMHHSRFDFTDGLLVAVPVVLLALLGWSFDPAGWLGGIGLGFPIGFFLVSRRK